MTELLSVDVLVCMPSKEEGLYNNYGPLEGSLYAVPSEYGADKLPSDFLKLGCSSGPQSKWVFASDCLGSCRWSPASASLKKCVVCLWSFLRFHVSVVEKKLGS